MIPLIAVAGLAVAGLVLSVFWKEIKDFIIASTSKIKTVIIPSAIVGFRTYLETGSVARGFLKAMQTFYTRNTQGQWQETVVTRTISEKEVPKDIKAKAKNHTRVDITEDVQKELQLEI
ncbi:conserved hypothetical protein [Enhydrobacter sp. AX1]|nr:hypothetical protein [Enhydrobacter sp. AX1]VXA91475.1 conserved hypothetical protein [Enhydrobacter sp. AX1]